MDGKGRAATDAGRYISGMMQIKKTYFITLRVCFLIILLCLFIGCTPESKEVSNNKPFSSQEWKKGDAKIRGNMSTDLIDKKILIGKTKSEIESLLGKPDEIKEKKYIYFLESDFMGPWRTFMHVEFTKPEAVSSVWIND